MVGFSQAVTNRWVGTVIPPLHYVHVMDTRTNIQHMECGPKTWYSSNYFQKTVTLPMAMVVVPPNHYVIVENPVMWNEEGTNVVIDAQGQVKQRHGCKEVRLHQEPFGLHPGERLVSTITQLRTISINQAFRLRARVDCVYMDQPRKADEEWLLEGPGLYIPHVDVTVVETVVATIIGPGQALRLRARKKFKSRSGVERVAGEEWHVTTPGEYLPDVHEEVIELVEGVVLTEQTALHLRATHTFVDAYKTKRCNGQEWLVTSHMAALHIPSVYETQIGVINITTLSSRQYTVIVNPVDEGGVPQLGKKRLVNGPQTFFLQPGERLESNIEDVIVLGPEESLVLVCTEMFETKEAGSTVVRSPGDRWLVRGPGEFTPPIHVKILHRRNLIPLDETDGIYVRDIATGKVRAVCGQSYLLTESEELWNKELPTDVERLLSEDPLAERSSTSSKNKASSSSSSSSSSCPRDKTRVVTFKIPHNSAVQIYDYKKKKSRVEFGPNLVMLMPDEQFTQINLSGGKPKRPNMIRSLCLLLGPDFCTDIITVETSDHARLSLQLSYNWMFELGEEEPTKLFSVPDFIGDMCKAIASRVRGAVAAVAFDDFHKHSASIIRTAAFGLDSDQQPRGRLTFSSNTLNVTSIDIQSVEPVDQRTRDSLQKSVQLAIEITTNSLEASAKHDAERVEQEARGRLERARIHDEAEAERAKQSLVELQNKSAELEAMGTAKADASARVAASHIEAEHMVTQARLRSEANVIELETEFNKLKQAREAEINFQKQQDELEIQKLERMNQLQEQHFKQTCQTESDKFTSMVSAIGKETLVAMASAGPETQVKLLKSLGLQTTLITDGNSPINLFGAAQGLLNNNQNTQNSQD
eukprot:Lithocolla_globosa_v1_NODE_903_length_3103_cov_38.322507.p1 type:complete len:871 gc:universal NODE_903_length_3103_cov_38.322507:349-2961(+)